MRTGTILLAAVVLGGCVSVPVERGRPHDPKATDLSQLPADFGGGVVIPIGQPVPEHERALVEVYQGVLARMHEAYGGRLRKDGPRRPDLPALRDLLATWRRPDLPVWAREQIDSYAAAAEGLAFELHAATNATITAAAAEGDGDEIGEQLRLHLELPAGADPFELRGGDDADALRFAIALQIEDLFVDGTRRTHEDSTSVRLPEEFALRGGAALVLPFEADLADNGALRRTVRVRVDVLPGFVFRDGQRFPVRRTTVAATSRTQLPRGYQPIAAQPLLTLRAALAKGDAEHLPHVFLAALLAKDEDRAAVTTLLVESVRAGRLDQAHVAMAALAATTGAAIPIGDREAWLQWSQARR